MALLTVNVDSESIRDYTPSNNKIINKSGIYDVILKNVIIDSTTGGATVFNLFVNYEGVDQMIYSNIVIIQKNGEINNVGVGMLQRLIVCLGGGTGEYTIDDPITGELPIGPKGAMKVCNYIDMPEFKDVPITIRIQLEYTSYNGNIIEKKVIKNFYNSINHQTSSEIINGLAEDGVLQYEKEAEVADRNYYKDGLTAEDVEAWIKNGRTGSASKDKKPESGFGQKRSFGFKK